MTSFEQVNYEYPGNSDPGMLYSEPRVTNCKCISVPQKDIKRPTYIQTASSELISCDFPFTCYRSILYKTQNMKHSSILNSEKQSPVSTEPKNLQSVQYTLSF